MGQSDINIAPDHTMQLWSAFFLAAGLVLADDFDNALNQLKGEFGDFGNFDHFGMGLNEEQEESHKEVQDDGDERHKRHPQFTHFGGGGIGLGITGAYSPLPVAPAPAPYAPPAPAPYAPPVPAPVAPYHPPAPAYHEPAPYHPPAPAYHEPAPYHPPKPHHDPYHKEHHDPYHNEHGVPGIPCKDYPCLAEAPYTKFSCASVPFRPGMYADPESGCQAYRVCNDGRDGPSGAGFVYPNGTLFDQYQFACEFWNKVDCSKAVSLYDLNLDPHKNPYYPKPKLDEYGHPIPPHADIHHAPVHVGHHAAPIHHAAPVHPIAPHHAVPVHHPAPIHHA